MINSIYPKRIRCISGLVLLIFLISILLSCCKSDNPNKPILVMYAFPAEGELLAKKIQTIEEVKILGRMVSIGKYNGHAIVLAESGVGMTNASMMAQTLIDRFQPERLIFTGIAGAIDSSVHIGDIVVCEKWATHDYGYIGKDGLTPEGIDIFFPFRDSVFEVIYIETDSTLLDKAIKVSKQDLAFDLIGDRKPLVITGGTGVSGNSFIDNRQKRKWLYDNYSALVTDMESAAVAQVCISNGVPFIIFRSASDLAGGSGTESAAKEIDQFFRVAARNSARVVIQYLSELE